MEERKYIRDHRSPKPTSSTVSKVMSANKAKDTKPELALRKALSKNGIRGYRLHPKNVPGRPDICFTKKKLAIFVNGCYWHRCPYCKYPLPKHNTDFWQQKFSTNITRDKTKIAQLKKLGWRTITIWECQIRKALKTSVKKIEKASL